MTVPFDSSAGLALFRNGESTSIEDFIDEQRAGTAGPACTIQEGIRHVEPLLHGKRA